MSYSTLGGTLGLTRRITRPLYSGPTRIGQKAPVYQSPPIWRPTKVPAGYQIPYRVKVPFIPMNGLGAIAVGGRGNPTISQLSKFLENYKSYVLAFSPATNSVVAYPQGMKTIAFSIKLAAGEPTDAGLSRARARIDGPGSLNGLGDFNPHTAWGGKTSTSTRSGNGLRREAPFYAGVAGVTPIVLDPPIEEQEIRFDAPSLTLYMGSNKIALIPALISALAVKVILLGGSKVATASKFWGAAGKAERKLARG